MFSVIYAQKKRGFKYKEKLDFLRSRTETFHLEVIQIPAINNLIEKTHIHADVHLCVCIFIYLYDS